MAYTKKILYPLKQAGSTQVAAAVKVATAR